MAKRVNAGALRERLLFQENVGQTDEPDGIGGYGVIWQDYYECWGRLIPLPGDSTRGTQVTVSDILVGASYYRVNVRSDSKTRAMTTDFSFLNRGCRYRIKNIGDMDGRKDMLEMIAVKNVTM